MTAKHDAPQMAHLSRAIASVANDIRAAFWPLVWAGLPPFGVYAGATALPSVAGSPLVDWLFTLSLQHEEEAFVFIGLPLGILVLFAFQGLAIVSATEWAWRRTYRVEALELRDGPRLSYLSWWYSVLVIMLFLSAFCAGLPLLVLSPLVLMVPGAILNRGLSPLQALRFSSRHYRRAPGAATAQALVFGLLSGILSSLPVVGWGLYLPAYLLCSMRIYEAYYGKR